MTKINSLTSLIILTIKIVIRTIQSLFVAIVFIWLWGNFLVFLHDLFFNPQIFRVGMLELQIGMTLFIFFLSLGHTYFTWSLLIPKKRDLLIDIDQKNSIRFDNIYYLTILGNLLFFIGYFYISLIYTEFNQLQLKTIFPLKAILDIQLCVVILLWFNVIIFHLFKNKCRENDMTLFFNLLTDIFILILIVQIFSVFLVYQPFHSQTQY